LRQRGSGAAKDGSEGGSGEGQRRGRWLQRRRMMVAAAEPEDKDKAAAEEENSDGGGRST
jgi:hypothetical protein